MTSLSIRFRIDFGKRASIGPGKIALLEQIESTGSLSQSARALKMSYSRAWQLLESMNASFRDPVARKSTGGRGGGGASLTPFGRLLIKAYRRFEDELSSSAKVRFREIEMSVRHRRLKTAVAPVLRLSSSR